MKTIDYGRKLIKATFYRRPYPLADGEALELSLHVARPENDAGEILDSTEVSSPGYRRLTLPRTAAEWEMRPGAEVANVRTLIFPGVGPHKVRYLLLRGAQSGVPVRVARHSRPVEVSAERPYTLRPGELVFTDGGLKGSSLKWGQRILACEFHGAAFPIEGEEYLELRLYETDPQNASGDLVGSETSYPRYRPAQIKRDLASWERHDGEVANSRAVAFPGLLAEDAKGRTWPIRWYALVGAKTAFPVRVKRLEDTMALKGGYRLVLHPGDFTVAEA